MGNTEQATRPAPDGNRSCIRQRQVRGSPIPREECHSARPGKPRVQADGRLSCVRHLWKMTHLGSGDCARVAPDVGLAIGPGRWRVVTARQGALRVVGDPVRQRQAGASSGSGRWPADRSRSSAGTPPKASASPRRNGLRESDRRRCLRSTPRATPNGDPASSSGSDGTVYAMCEARLARLAETVHARLRVHGTRDGERREIVVFETLPAR